MEVTTAREALLAELMLDVDALIKRLEALDSAMASKIEQAVKDAAGTAFLTTRMGFESMLAEQERKLMGAGRNAAAAIHVQLTTGATQLIATNESLERKASRFIAMLAGMALVAGLIGGVVAAKIMGA